MLGYVTAQLAKLEVGGQVEQRGNVDTCTYINQSVLEPEKSEPRTAAGARRDRQGVKCAIRECSPLLHSPAFPQEARQPCQPAKRSGIMQHTTMPKQHSPRLLRREPCSEGPYLLTLRSMDPKQLFLTRRRNCRKSEIEYERQHQCCGATEQSRWLVVSGSQSRRLELRGGRVRGLRKAQRRHARCYTRVGMCLDLGFRTLTHCQKSSQGIRPELRVRAFVIAQLEPHRHFDFRQFCYSAVCCLIFHASSKNK
ncbi:hypothetical protein PHSY_003441 [Pseudozyma hubeiensis SY62]|uniref:Uncharacterized protein n=1 Tax=Pseudozyma hubeiensis (strain SY62) TaxID=1305764 RepID=R9P3K5_PSEHS|nr:hypothetical protein PHSY_003441 [Pseudozyma hubeiensis SY62]GAC95864.1 hypothetical protein PHSY_003441 [Pseudozyma hubeiensis SY62]